MPYTALAIYTEIISVPKTLLRIRQIPKQPKSPPWSVDRLEQTLASKDGQIKQLKLDLLQDSKMANTSIKKHIMSAINLGQRLEQTTAALLALMNNLNQQRTKIKEDVSGSIARILDKEIEKFQQAADNLIAAKVKQLNVTATKASFLAIEPL
jgi:hypothetical protein